MQVSVFNYSFISFINNQLNFQEAIPVMNGRYVLVVKCIDHHERIIVGFAIDVLGEWITIAHGILILILKISFHLINIFFFKD